MPPTLLSDLLDHLNDLVQSVGPDGRLLYVNRAWREALGYSGEEVADLHLSDVVHPEDWEHCAALFERVCAGEDVGVVRVRFRGRDGRVLWLEGRSSCRFEEGRPVATRGVFRDVTEERRRAAALAESERRYGHLVETSLGLLCTHDFDGRMLSVNPAGARAFGLEPEEMIGRHLAEFMDPERRPEVYEYLDEIRREGRASGEFQARSADGEERVFAYSNSVFSEAGEPRWVVGHAHDVTEMKRVEEVLRSASLTDPLTGLANRRGFEVCLAKQVGSVTDAELWLAFTSPDNFDLVNERFGLEAGDRVLVEVAERLGGQAGGAGRYGGAVFGFLLSGADRAELEAEVERRVARLAGDPYLDGAVRLSFSLGAACLEAVSSEVGEGGAADELVRLAEGALHAAKLTGGARTVFAGDDPDSVAEGDRLGGIFTAHLARDYRNMLLLWDTVRTVATAPDAEQLMDRMVAVVLRTLQPERMALFTRQPGVGPAFLVGGERGSAPTWRAERMELAPRARRLVEEATATGRTLVAELPDLEGSGDEEGDGGAVEGRRHLAGPLVAGGRTVGCFYLEARAGRLDLDQDDLPLLEGLGAQLALAVERALAESEQRERKEAERRRLESELQELREALQRSRLVVRSGVMEKLLHTVGRVAATDATVLLTGPTGTGKELLARTLHDLSPRRHRPPVIVDCAALAQSLAASELFGHERGAFTGADKRFGGRLAEADGSTLVLDEIGELPLEVQGKLLRFVQERELVAVGGTRPLKLDTRIVAVTHRDLEREVAEGRFREDLYYRLAVLRLWVPPLTERPDDVLPLAEHFLDLHALRHGKRLRLSSEAQEALLAHDWPGNVRELEHRLLQGVVLAEGGALSARDLGLEAEPGSSSPIAVPGHAPGPVDGPASVGTPASADDPHPAPAPAPASNGSTRPERAPTAPPSGSERAGEAGAAEGWPGLELALGAVVAHVLVEPGPVPPLGRWLDAEWVHAAHTVAGGVGRRAADLLGLPESTYRRRLRKVRREAAGGAPPGARLAPWAAVRAQIEQILERPRREGEERTERARRLLLGLVVEHLAGRGGEASLGADLMGVSRPTFRRWTDALVG